MDELVGSCPLPEDPVLAAVASALNELGFWAHLVDARWRYVFETDELRSTFADICGGSAPPLPIGSHFFSAEVRERFAAIVGGPQFEEENYRSYFLDVGRFVLAATPGGRDELRQVVEPGLADLVDELSPRVFPVVWVQRNSYTTAGIESTTAAMWFRIDDGRGNLAGFCILSKPAAGMSDLARATALADFSHLNRMRTVDPPDRRPAQFSWQIWRRPPHWRDTYQPRSTLRLVGVSYAPPTVA